MEILDPSQILTLEEVAARLKVPPRWVYERTRKRSQNKIPHTKFGKKTIRFNWAAVSLWWKQNEHNPVDGGITPAEQGTEAKKKRAQPVLTQQAA